MSGRTSGSASEDVLCSHDGHRLTDPVWTESTEWSQNRRRRGGGEGTDAGPGSRAPGTECAGRSSDGLIAVLSHTPWETLRPISHSSLTEDKCLRSDTPSV